ncbi:HEPN domain-containing protein [Persephonella sp.]
MKEEIIDYWIDKSRKSLKSAILEYQQGYLDFSVNRLYYAVFYITSAYFFQNGKYFKKHSGLRASFHKEIVKKGKIDKVYGKLYDELFEAREEGDYKPFASFEKEQVEEWIKLTEEFIEKMEALIRNT